MAFFDFMSSNSNVDPMGYAGPQNNLDSSFNAGGFGSDAMRLFEDPNFIRMLGETGANISAPGSIGRAVGTGASDLVRRRQFQKAAAKGQDDENDFRTKFLEAINNGDLLSPTEDNKGFDSVTFDGDGGFNAKMKASPSPYKIPGTEKSLEGIESFDTPTEPQVSGGRSDIDYSPFF